MTFTLSALDPLQTYQDQKRFECGNPVIDKFVRNDIKTNVKKRLSVAHVLLDSAENNRFVGFYTLAQHQISLDALSALELGSMPRLLPCTRLVMLGVASTYQKQKLGLKLMKHALQITKEISKTGIGGVGLYLDADIAAVGFYQSLGFALLEDKRPQPSPMFLHLDSIP